MVEWLLQVVGGGEAVGEVERVGVYFARPGVLIAGLVLLVPIGLLVHLRHRRGLAHVSGPMRGLLTGCRVGLLLLLVLIIAGPFARLSAEVERKPRLAVVVDRSGSMDLPLGETPADQMAGLARAAGLVEREASGAEGGGAVQVTAAARKRLGAMTRGELLAAMLRGEAGRVLAELDERFDVRVYAVAADVREVELETMAGGGDGQAGEAARVGGDRAGVGGDGDADGGGAGKGGAARRGATALGTGIERAMLDAGGRELAGVVVLSDGRSTAGPSPMSVVQRRRERGVGGSAGGRVWAVPIGSARRLVDVAVVDVLAPRQVARGDTAAVLATLESSGLDQRQVKVELRIGERTVDETKLTLRGGGQQRVQLEYDAEESGDRLLTVHVAEQPEERVTANNTLRTPLSVDAERWKLLVIEGYPRWDFRFLDHGLRRDPGIEPRFIIEAAVRDRFEGDSDSDGGGGDGERLAAVAGLPSDADGWAEYDAVLLGDVSRAMLDDRAAEQLAIAVRKRGLGLIVQAGFMHMPHRFVDSPLAELLPTTLAEGDGVAEGNAAGVAAPAYAPFVMKLTAAGSVYPAFSLSGNATRDRQIWGRMPPFYWAAAVDRAKPAATVLAEIERAEGDRPFIVEHFAGRGRVMLVGGDSTYRWRRNVGDHLFYRFWGQAIRRVAGGKRREAGRSWMTVEPTRTEPGEPVTVELHAVGEDGEPMRAERAMVTVRGGNASDGPTTLALDRVGEAGMYRGTWQGEAVGDYELTYEAERGRTLRQTVAVAAADRETREPDVDRDTLGALAAATGGELLEPGEFARLPELLEGEARTESSVREHELWDNWLTLVLIVCLYGTDLFVRRMSGLT